jgi:hypothetical protein
MRCLWATISALFLLFLVPILGSADVVSERRAQLEHELALLEQEIAGQQQLLNAKAKERSSLERDVAILDAEIQKARLQIRARTLEIEKLNTGISGKEAHIGALDSKLERERQSLAQILRKANEIGEYSVLELVLGSQSLSAFYEDFDTFASVQESLSASFELIGETRVTTEGEKEALLDRRAQELELRRLQELEKGKIETAEKEKQRILSVTKGQEIAYQNFIKEKQKSAAQIRAELFSLRDSAAIPFGTALTLAQRAEAATGVRAALILGVLKQETNLGENTGTGVWTTDMHPTRDQPVFRYIMEVLGLNPDVMPVSRKPSYGWGGAMGPSQFIPSTWVCYGGFINVNTGDCGNSKRSLSWDAFWQGPWEYRANTDRIRTLVGGNDPSNPWTNEDAFMATALLMKENGASKGTREAERLAALRYFAGWSNATKPAYAFYGDAVIEFADYFETQIIILEST